MNIITVMVRKKRVVAVVGILIALVLLFAAGFFLLNNKHNKKITNSLPIDNNPLYSKPLAVVSDLSSIKQYYAQKQYDKVIKAAESVYRNEQNPLDFRVAALGYCVRSLTAQKKDSSECQSEADGLINPATGVYKQFLLDAFNDKPVASQ